MTDAAEIRDPADSARWAEVDRILSAFRLNPYDILDIRFSATEAEIKKQYRKKSLLIHPDKFKRGGEKADEAFDLMKKAESQLSEPTTRAAMDSIIKHARAQVISAACGDDVSPNIADDDPRLANLKPPFDAQLRVKTRMVLMQEEENKRNRTKVAAANEAAEKAKLDEEKAARKRKAEEAVKWEDQS